MTEHADEEIAKEPEPSRTEQARKVAKAYADDLREIIKKLRKKAPVN
jgi:hypothetical protein